MARTTEDDLLWARSGSKTIHAVRWSTNQARIVKSKKRGHELLMVWKKWKQRQGWQVLGSSGSGYVATSPSGVQEACALRSYRPDTLEQLS